MIQRHTFHALEPGLHLLVLGAVHGNEPCGTLAIRRVMQELGEGTLELAKGRVSFVPVCNPKAFALDVRQTERNLNRYLVPMERPDCYEAQLGNVLCPILADCDILLDIHSYTVGGAPFVLVKDFASDADCAFATALEAEVLLTGWNTAYAATGRKAQAVDANESVGTTEYARRFGALAVTLECGQHKAPESPEIAYRAIHNALRHLGLVTGIPQPQTAAPRRITMEQVFYRDAGGELARNWQNFEPIAVGTLIAHSPARKVLADKDCVIIMPKIAAAEGEEWFYLGRES
ncbi:MAG: succinylglutamate desuccinylase [Proteobacteria bacterium]|nr:succinylglutamate desuccinylase [Pseudomonadota bacterium]